MEDGSKIISVPREQSGPRTAVISSGFEGHGVAGALAGTVEICVDGTSPSGTYMFTNSGWSVTNGTVGVNGVGKKLNGAPDIDATQYEITNLVDRGTTTFPNGGTSAPYEVVKGAAGCKLILVRSAPSAHYNGTDGDGFGPDNLDDWQGVRVVASSIPAGVTFDRVDCVLDIGTFPPSNSAGVRVCEATSNPLKANANYDHGARLIFVFKEAPQELPCPAGSFTWSVDGSGNLNIKYDQFPAPNDNSYGENSVGWKANRPHRFKDLVNSDHAGIQLKNPSGQVKLSFLVDYLSASASAPSGYASLGVTGGDGGMLVGTASGITATTSEANNLNNINIPGLFNAATHTQLIGSVDVLEDSPPTDPAHQTYVISDPALAGWDFHNTYYVTISASKLAGLGFNPATWTVVPNADALHNSPEKACPTL